MAKTASASRNGTAKRAANRAERASRREDIVARWEFRTLKRTEMDEFRVSFLSADHEYAHHRQTMLYNALLYSSVFDTPTVAYAIPDEWLAPLLQAALRVIQLKELSYDEYLQTPEWKRKAEKAKERFAWACALDDSHPAEHAHHRTYARRGRELEEDIIPLCSDCHAKFHGKR